MLAQSAKQGNWQAYVADAYADQDTQQLAHQFYKLAVCSSGLETTGLLAAIDYLTAQQSILGLVYASGLESHPKLLQQIARHYLIFGNSFEQVEQVKNPHYFFKLLTQLDIPFPTVRFNPPVNPKGWLCKPSYSEGGQGIHPATQSTYANSNRYYFQKHISGNSYSALFLADGQCMKIIGFNQQYISAPYPATPYLFTGIINRTPLSSTHQQHIRRVIQKLVIAVGLKGLNSLDFMLEDSSCQVLEINPRPSASMALYDQDFPQGLLTEHIHACQRSLDNNLQHNPHPVRIYHIIYAVEPVSIPLGIQWPRWCTDRPLGGTDITAGQPIAAINAEAATVKSAEKQIQIRETAIRDRIASLGNPFNHADNPII